MVLGGLFFYAGLQKVLHPYEFAEAVLAYQLLPESLVGAGGGGAAVGGDRGGARPGGGAQTAQLPAPPGGLVAGFLVVILITMARGLKIDCGCGLFFQRQVGLGRGSGRPGAFGLGRGALLVGVVKGGERWAGAGCRSRALNHNMVRQCALYEKPKNEKRKTVFYMARFFNFYDPLEKRYVFNSFLVVVGLVEILILGLHPHLADG